MDARAIARCVCLLLPVRGAPVAALQLPRGRRRIRRARAIASGHALATDAGLQILRAGGNAFDAAVAVSSTLSVVEPISSGLGGGGFFLLHDAKTGRDVFLDARETSPAVGDAAGVPRRDTARSTRTGRRTGRGRRAFPGLPAALVELAGKYGRLPLKTSLAPAIRIAREGFPVYARLEKGYRASGAR